MNAEVGLALRAWGVGLATLALVVLPGATVLDGILTDPFLETLLPRLIAFFGMMLPGVWMTATFGVLLSAPLFLVAFLVSLAFRRSIARHPLLFALAAPLVAVGMVAVVTVALREASPAGLMPWLRDLLEVALRRDSLLIALPIAAGSFFFCLGLARLERSREQATVG
jgi:hypothetical protein